ncbi:MAG: ThuA domain-containing protein [Verrucomicrobia bacterium]|nr:ThuA domain-containing protein [Verrucomicrobiota bacterium]
MKRASNLRLLAGVILLGLAWTGWAADRKLVIVAGKPSHPPLMHEFNAGCILLHKRLQGVPGLEVRLHLNGWPADAKAFDGADAVFLYMDGGGGHPAIQPENLKLLGDLAKRGVGLGCAHFAVEVPADRGGAEFKEWIGGHYEHLYSCNPIFDAEFKSFPEHPITRGVRAFTIKDEWYFNMRFRPDMARITPILVTVPSDDVRDGPYVYPQGPYPHIVAAKGREEIMMWAVERADGGRGFGFTGGHFHVNWAHDDFRKVVLNSLLWLAKVEVPDHGFDSAKVTDEELLENLDPKGGPKPTLRSAADRDDTHACCEPLVLPREMLAWLGMPY